MEDRMNCRKKTEVGTKFQKISGLFMMQVYGWNVQRVGPGIYDLMFAPVMQMHKKFIATFIAGKCITKCYAETSCRPKKFATTFQCFLIMEKNKKIKDKTNKN